MKFLSKLAEYFGKGLQILGVFEPIVERVLPASVDTKIETVSEDLKEMAGAIMDAERIGVALQLKGPDKLKAAAPAVADIILRSALLANHRVANVALFQQGAAKMADGMADVINSLHIDGITVENKQA